MFVSGGHFDLILPSARTMHPHGACVCRRVAEIKESAHWRLSLPLFPGPLSAVVAACAQNVPCEWVRTMRVHSGHRISFTCVRVASPRALKYANKLKRTKK